MESSSSFEDSQLGQMAIQKSEELFRACDEENKGFIIKRDMQRLSNELPGLTPDQLEEVFDSLDQDGNGFLTMEEFTKGFGAFLGLQMPSEDEQEMEQNSDMEPELLNEDERIHGSGMGVVEEEQFQELMESLGASEIFKESDQTANVKNMWDKMRKDDPELLSNFENFLSQVSGEIRKSQDGYSALEQALEQKGATHEAEVKKLYEEMESQIRAEKEKVLDEERAKLQKLHDDMEGHMKQKDGQLQDLVSKHAELERKMSLMNKENNLTAQQNDELQKEREAFAKAKEELENALEKTQSTLDETTVQLEAIKKQAREEKRERFKQSFKVTEGIASEREGLVKQLDMLRTVNKELKDAKDIQMVGGKDGFGEDGESINFDDPNNPNASASGQNQRTKNAQETKMANLMNEPSVEECDLDSQMSSPVGMMPPGRGGVSLMDELGQLDNGPGGRRDESSYMQRVAPVGGNAKEPDSLNSSLESGIDPANPERVFKVVFVGDSGVGKTCVIHRFCQQRFKPTFSATIGVDFQVKSMIVDGHCIALQLWDTAGQERFRSITKQYFRKADGVVLMYDVTSELSFVNLRNWIQSVKDGTEEGCVLCLIGNKIDLCENDESRVLKYKDGQKLADEFGALFFETSASSGESIHDCMQAMAVLLREREDSNLENALKLNEMEIEKRRKCCNK